MRKSSAKPPPFLELLRERHTEEEYEASRAKLNHSVYTVHTKLQKVNKQSELHSLRAEIKEVKIHFCCTLYTRQSDVKRKPSDPETTVDSEAIALWKLQQKVNSKYPPSPIASPICSDDCTQSSWTAGKQQ